MNKHAYLFVASLSLVSVSALAAPPECKEPKAPSGCFRLVPIEVCDRAPIFDPEHGRITYPCGLGLWPKEPGKPGPKGGKIEAKTLTSTASLNTAPLIPYRGPSTIKDNGDGTATINHGGGVSETINAADKERTVKEYGDRGVKVVGK